MSTSTRWENQIIHDDALSALHQLPDESVHCIITSPPYYQQRDYESPNQIGSEATPDLYIEHLQEIFMECRRVLINTGTLWLNLGDKYENGELLGLPWQSVFALKRQGWLLRSDIIWHKPNAMPSSVKNRPTTDHEYMFMFAKQSEYYYDVDAIREPHITFTEASRMKGGRNHFGKVGGTPEQGKNGGNPNLHNGRWDQAFNPKGRNRRTVWSIPVSKFRDAHFAVFPETLVEICMLAGTQEGQTVLDPFVGSGTTAVVAQRLGRKFVGIDCNLEYCEIARSRVQQMALL